MPMEFFDPVARDYMFSGATLGFVLTTTLFCRALTVPRVLPLKTVFPQQKSSSLAYSEKTGGFVIFDHGINHAENKEMWRYLKDCGKALRIVGATYLLGMGLGAASGYFLYQWAQNQDNASLHPNKTTVHKSTLAPQSASAFSVSLSTFPKRTIAQRPQHPAPSLG